MKEGVNNEIRQTILSHKGVLGMVYYFPGCSRKENEGNLNRYDEIALSPIQTHSNNVRIVNGSANDMFANLDDTDALITFNHDLSIGVRTADCVPILIYSPDVNGIAAVHAGWKGTLGGIVDNVLDVLEKKGAELSELIVVFGPSISFESYEVDEDLAEKFISAGFSKYVGRNSIEKAKPHIDLQGVNIERLRRRGVRMENIQKSSLCTFSSTDENGHFLFPSYRRDKTSDRILTTIVSQTR